MLQTDELEYLGIEDPVPVPVPTTEIREGNWDSFWNRAANLAGAAVKQYFEISDKVTEATAEIVPGPIVGVIFHCLDKVSTLLNKL